MRTGMAESVHELRSMTVGTINGNGTRAPRVTKHVGAGLGPYEMFGRSRFGVSSIGAEARLPWNVWPTTTVKIAPLASSRSSAGGASVRGSEEVRHLLRRLRRAAPPAS